MNDSLIYFKEGKVVASSGDVKVYEMGNKRFLEKGPAHNLWAHTDELKDYIEQLHDFPRGDVLEIGLGLGVVSHYLLTFPNVKSLTTVEIDQDVINTYEQLLEIDDVEFFNKLRKEKNHQIVCADGVKYPYQTDKKFDFIFLDFYTHIDEETLPEIADVASNCVEVLRSGGKVMGWLDPHTFSEHASTFMLLFDMINDTEVV